MRLVVVYRSTARENTKPRPPYYSKLVCLLSLLRALEHCSASSEIVYYVDGAPAETVAPLMHKTGEVVTSQRAGLAESYMGALRVGCERADAEDLVYFGEDDYLYRPEAFDSLVAAATAIPRASYFGLYAAVFELRAESIRVGDAVWRTGDSTTSSFAVRGAALRKDLRLHGLGPRFGRVWDQEICLAYSGVRPFRWSSLLGQALGGMPPGEEMPTLLRLKHIVGRSWMNVIAIQRAFRPHQLIAPRPLLASHLELPYMAEGTDWEAVAADTGRWATEAYGIDVS